MKSLILVFITSLYLYPATSIVKASFDCKFAKTNIEKLICSDVNLGRKDIELSEIYYSVKRELKGKVQQHLYSSQIRWITKKRAKCLLKRAKVICLMGSYNKRIEQIKYLKKELKKANSSYAKIKIIESFDRKQTKIVSVVIKKEPIKERLAEEFKQVQKSLKKYNSMIYPINNLSSEGGEVMIYRDKKGEIIFAEVTLFGDTFKDEERFYYKNRKLVYGETTYYAYNSPMYTKDFDSTKTVKFINRYYFKDSKLIKWIQGSEVINEGSSFKTKSDYLEELSVRVLSFN